MEKGSIAPNILNPQTWLRGLFMVLFIVIYGVTEILIGAVAVLQFLFVLFTGERNGQLLAFGSSLSRFVYLIIRFWTFNRDEKPFPFEAWPSAKLPTEEGEEAAAGDQ